MALGNLSNVSDNISALSSPSATAASAPASTGTGAPAATPGDSAAGPLHLSDAAANEASLQPQRLSQSVELAMKNYFKQLDGQPATNVYEMVLNEIEAPLLRAVMDYTRDNQTKASELLGLNRGTLRKKLKQYGLL